MSKRTHGNKEAKKPKQGPARAVPPPTGGPNAPVQTAWPRPQTPKK